LWGPLDPAHHAATDLEQKLLRASRLFGYLDRNSALERASEKWIFNVVINTLSAAFRLPRNGLLLERLSLVQRAFEEAYPLAREVWSGYPTATPEAIWDRLLQLIHRTADN